MSSGDPVTGAVLFTDLVGFTAFTDAVGDRAALEVLERQTAIALTVVGAADGARIVKELGDGLLLWFPTADAGMDGALDLRDRIDTARRAGFPLAVRMGLHHGEVVRRGDDVVGRTVNIGARIAALAGPGELLVSDAAVDACAGACDHPLVPVGPVSVKGIGEPIWLRRLA